MLPPRRTIGHPSNSSSVSEAVFPGIYPVRSVEKWKIKFHQKYFTSNQLFSKNVDFTDILLNKPENVRPNREKRYHTLLYNFIWQAILSPLL